MYVYNKREKMQAFIMSLQKNRKEEKINSCKDKKNNYLNTRYSI